MKTESKKIQEVVKREITIKFENSTEYNMFTRLMCFDLAVPEIVYDDTLRAPLGQMMRDIAAELQTIR